MHSVHQSVIRRHNNGTAADHNLQHSQDHISAHDQQQQQQQDKQNNQQHDLSSMTVLETLEPVQGAIEPQQPVLSTLDPVQEQPPIIHHHLVASPRLHGLHPASQHEDQDERHQQQQHELSESARRQQQHQQRQKPMAQLMAEGIVAEGGGPIVQWLLDNYEIAEGESLPRSTVYNHYLAHCKQLRISSVNAASFGKLIRSVFLGLKTRRLGTRGHSKYHYFGVQAKAHVRLAWLSQGVGSNGQAMGPGCSSNLLNDNSNNGTDGSESDSTGDGGRSSSMMSDSNKRLRRSTNNDNESSAVYAHHQNYHRSDSSSHQNFMQANYTTEHHDQNQSQHQQQSQASNGMYYSGGHGAPPSAPLAQATNGYDKHSGGEAANAAIASDAPYYVQVPRYDHYDLSSFRNHLGANKASLVDEHWPERDGQLLERAQQQSSRTRAETNKSAANNNNHLHVTSGLVDTFESQYKSYYKRMVEFLGELQFGEIEHLTMDFWHPVPMPAAHETIHWTSTTTSAVSTPSGPCDIVVASSPAANTNGAHHMSYADQQRQQDALHHQLLQQQQQEHQMMYQNMNSLTVDQLYQLTSNPAMIDRINQIDCRLYSAIESYLVVDMLQPLPRPLVHHLRLFARNICSWIEQAVKEYRTEFINEKMKSTRAFEQALRRSTSVNHLATASRSIWSKRAVLHQMGSDLSRLDLHDIELQVAALMTSQENSSATSSSLVHLDSDDSHHHHQQHTTTTHNGCEPMQQADRPNDNNSTKRTYPSSQSDDNIENHYRESNSHGHNTGSLSAPGCGRSDDICVSLQPGQLIQNLIHLLEDPYPAEAWPNWCQTLVESRVCGQSFEEARSFILKWNFYISLVSRELTLRSAPSLGSFQLIRLLFDEYMFYLVVKRLAQVQHKTPTQLLRPSVRYENI